MAAEDIVAYGESYQKYVDTLDAVETASRTSYSKGIEKGIEKGREEERAKSIRIMYEMGIPVETISEKFDVSISYICDVLK